MKMTVEGIKNLNEMPIPDRYDMTVSEMHSIKEYADTFGRSGFYYLMISAFKLGFKRGRSYQKKQEHK